MKQRRITLPNGRRIQINPEPPRKILKKAPAAAYPVTGTLDMAIDPEPNEPDFEEQIPRMMDVRLTRQQRDALSGTLTEIPRMVQTCRRVAEALIATHRSLVRPHPVLSLLFPTDYERARRRIIRMCTAGRRQLRRLRKQSISPETIWAISYINDIRQSCRNCLRSNIASRQTVRKFTCPIHKQLRSQVQSGFRFTLDQKGQIHESQ